MPRRAHRKSRKGCIECKRRHIKKCDETRPICSNCTSSERSCQYALDDDAVDTWKDRGPCQSTGSSPSRASHDPHISRAPSQNASEGLEIKLPSVNMQHVELFYHLTTETIRSLHMELQNVHIPFDKILKEVVSAPYLMNELLALAAIHRCILNPAKQDFYRRQATELQTHALSIFNQMKLEINAETCVPMFVFSSVLGLHEMCETFVFRETEFDPFLDKFVRYLSLHQGIKVITHGTWHMLNESVLKPLLNQGEAIPPLSTALGDTCSGLLDLIKTADLNPEHFASCEQAISALQSALGVAPPDAEGRPSINAILTWPVILCQGFTDLLRQREPHALVILAHYAAFVHCRRDLWMCGDGGRFLVNLISQNLGDEWADWLIWPNQAVSGLKSAIATDSLEV